MNAVVRREGPWWTVTYNRQQYGRMRYWCDAMKHARCVVTLIRRGEPTA